MLIVPSIGHYSGVGRRPFVAWNAARESARAVTDALPMLERADAVEVATFERPERSSAAPEAGKSEALARYLGRHGVKAKAASRHVSGELEVGEMILSRAADSGADVIVMGAYGHSRLRELVLGGATRAVLKSMTAPVLMSHRKRNEPKDRFDGNKLLPWANPLTPRH